MRTKWLVPLRAVEESESQLWTASFTWQLQRLIHSLEPFHSHRAWQPNQIQWANLFWMVDQHGWWILPVQSYLWGKSQEVLSCPAFWDEAFSLSRLSEPDAPSVCSQAHVAISPEFQAPSDIFKRLHHAHLNRFFWQGDRNELVSWCSSRRAILPIFNQFHTISVRSKVYANEHWKAPSILPAPWALQGEHCWWCFKFAHFTCRLSANQDIVLFFSVQADSQYVTYILNKREHSNPHFLSSLVM